MALLRKKQPELPRRRQSSQPGAVRPESTLDEGAAIFRRNRTLTGTSSNKINSIQAKADLESPRAHAHALSLRRRKITGIFFVVLFWSGILFWLISQFTGSPVIAVADSGISTTVDSARYEKAIQDYLDANPIGRLRFALDQQALSQYVSQALPEVASVSEGGLAGLGKSTFVLSMRHPVAGWKIGDKQYYVDASGVPFQTNYFNTAVVQISDQSGVGVVQGTAIVSNSFLGFVGRVVAAVNSEGYAVTGAIIPSNTTRQLEIQLKGYSFLVKLSIDRGAAEQVEDMSRSIKFLVSKGTTPQYIDVRVSGKAFYQ